ncbi:unnamed protein product [Boreogadus saida]
MITPHVVWCPWGVSAASLSMTSRPGPPPDPRECVSVVSLKASSVPPPLSRSVAPPQTVERKCRANKPFCSKGTDREAAVDCGGQRHAPPPHTPTTLSPQSVHMSLHEPFDINVKRLSP